MNREWYRDFFHGVALEFWRQAVPEEQTRAEAEFLQRELRLAPGARVLDVPCGAGRLSVPLAARGCRVTGVDIEPEALEHGHRRAAAAGADVEWRQAEMRDLPAQAGFDAAFCFGNSFGYLDRAGTRDFLRAIAGALRPGGRFAMDSGLTAETILPGLEERQEARIGEFLFVEHNRYHVRESCLETTYTFVRNGRSESRTALHWIFTTAEIVAFCADASLEVEGLYRSVAGEPFALGAPALFLVATRR